jgi:hypothetical protein
MVPAFVRTTEAPHYFYQRKKEEEAKPLPKPRRKPPGLVSRFLHWMAQPI